MARTMGMRGKIILASAMSCVALAAAVFVVKGSMTGGAPAGARGGGCRGCNVFVVVMDSLRPDHLGCYGYGGGTSLNIDAFAASAIRFETVLSTSSWTKPAITSVLTGKLPAGHGVHEMQDALPDGEVTLQRILAGEGYAFSGFVANRVFDGDIVRGFARIAGELKAETGYKAGSPATTDAVLERLAGSGPSRNFFYVHYMDTHVPYYVGEEPGAPGDGAPSSRYDEAVRLNDGQIGRLFDGIKRRGMWDRSIVVLMADHGEAFGEHGSKGHYNSLYDEEIRVPLIMRAPGVKPRVVGGIFSQVDVLPTLLSLLGIPFPEGIDGIDMLSGKRQLAISEMKKGDVHLVSARTAGHKLILDRRSGGRTCFDLAADPGEKEALAGGAGAACLGLEGAVDAYVSRGATGRAGKRAFSAQEREQLRALGYVDGDGGR